MRKILSAVVTLLLCIGTGAHAAVKPIPRNPALRLGTLPNGLTYYILHNNHPEHRVNFYIVQRVGSIQEEERQRGLAHFLEHMCFNGTEHFPGNQVVEYLESLGVKFGPNLNAHTSIDRTIYNINDVPSNRLSALDSCLLILRDWSCGLKLDSAEIERERGVVHEEWRQRNTDATPTRTAASCNSASSPITTSREVTPAARCSTETAISSDWHSTETGIACRATSTSTSDWHAASASTFDTCSS